MRPLPALLIAALLAAGCSTDSEPRQLTGDNFYRPKDQPGALPPGPVRQPEEAPPPSVTDQARRADDLRVATEQIPTPNPSDPTTAPAAATPPVSPKPPTAYAPGQYLTIGGVIADVNGNPIYADDVLRAVAPVLAARAKDSDPAAFKSLARNEINTQVDDLIRAEVEFAAADRNTTQQEKELAKRATTDWRTRIITKYKGSVEEARRSFREQGRTFDEAAREQDRTNLVRVYYSKKILPRIQITATEMRAFYEKNKETLFTDRDKLTFRLIKITPEAIGSDQAAQERVNELAAKAANGEDFAALAGSINNDPYLLKSAGLVGPIDKGAYKLEAIEAALWPLNVGQITPVIKIEKAYYLAKLEDKHTGRVLQFQEDLVQRKMTEAIKGEQFTKMRREMEASLRKESVVSKNPAMYESALGMAVQNYARWRAE
ncbi:MAG TPA: peptidyl-prolyl cis-trans isomerase [Tepidisphaeraceae bacterium]|jgi:parvulin-like peptidyl-prolyl isomerase